MLWLHFAICDPFEFEISIRGHSYTELTNDEANTKAEVGDTSFACVEIVLGFENGCEGCEEEVEVAIDHGHINSKQEDNRGAEKHFCGSHDRSGEQLSGCLAFVIFRSQVRIAGFYAQQLGLMFKDCRRIRLAEKKRRNNGKNSGLKVHQTYSIHTADKLTRIATSQKIQRQPAACARYPPTTGPVRNR